jgi:hypothetical protein
MAAKRRLSMSEPGRKIWMRLFGVTIHRPGPDFNPTISEIAGLSVPTGNRERIAIAPGVAFEIDEAALRLLIRIFEARERRHDFRFRVSLTNCRRS